MEVDVPWGLDPKIQMPIVLGTVPYRGTYGCQQQFGLPQEQMPIPEDSKKKTTHNLLTLNLDIIKSGESL